jgi:hypothetical protein
MEENNHQPIDNRVSPPWMPQVKAPKDYVLDYLNKMQIGYKEVQVDPKNLKPLQGGVNKQKVDFFTGAVDRDETFDPIYISGDDEILDGHHRAKAYSDHPSVEKCDCIKLYMDYRDAARILNRIQDKFEFENEGNMMEDIIPFREEKKEEPAVQSTPEVSPAVGDISVGDYAAPSTAQPETGVADELLPTMGNEGEEKNPQTLVLYSPKQQINTSAPTGAFVILTRKPRYDYEVEIEFDNLLEIAPEEFEGLKYPTEAALKRFGYTGDTEIEARTNSLNHEIYVSRKVNELAKSKGIDGIKYGELYVQLMQTEE